MSPAKRTAGVVVVSLTALLGACGGAPGSARLSRSGASGAPGALRHSIAIAQRVYENEIDGERVHSDLRLVAGDEVLLEDLARGDAAAAQARALHVMRVNGRDHITRVSVLRGGHALVNAVLNANGTFVVAPLQRALSLHGRSLGTLLVSVQDVVGYVKLSHKYTGAQIVARGSSGQVRTSLPAAARSALPQSGQVTIGGARYQVGAFRVGGWGGETLAVWVLQPS